MDFINLNFLYLKEAKFVTFDARSNFYESITIR